MSRKGNFVLVVMAFLLDIFTTYAWYVPLFPTEPVTIVEATIAGAILGLFSIIVLGINALIFMVALADD